MDHLDAEFATWQRKMWSTFGRNDVEQVVDRMSYKNTRYAFNHGKSSLIEKILCDRKEYRDKEMMRK